MLEESLSEDFMGYTEDVAPSDAAVEVSAEKLLTPQQKIFARGILSVAGVASLAEARAQEWKTLGNYYAPDRIGETTNYIFEGKGEERVDMDDTTARRCTICHQPLDYVNLVSVNGQTIQVGGDCLAKLYQFRATGEIVPQSSISKIWKDQTEVFLEESDLEKGIIDDQLREDATAKKERKLPVTKQRIVASMLSWVGDHIEDPVVPPEIKDAYDVYKTTGIFPSAESARGVSEFYKTNRKFLPDEVLDDRSLKGLQAHPHRQLLRKVISGGVTQGDLPRLEGIIHHHEDREKKRRDAEWALGYRAYKEKIAADRAAREVAAKAKTEERDKAHAAQRELKEQSRAILDEYEKQGLIEKHKFERFRFINGYYIGRFGIIYADSNRNQVLDTIGFTEVGDDGAVSLFEIDQQPPYGVDNEEKYYVIIGEPKTETRKAHTESGAEKLTNQLAGRNFAQEISGAELDELADAATPSITLKRYSCAQVVVQTTTGEPMVLLRDGQISLRELFARYDIAETPNEEDGEDLG